MEYIELTVHTTSLSSEIVADILGEITGEGVAIYDINDVLELNRTKKNWDYIEDNVLMGSDSDILIKCFIEKNKYKEKYIEILDALETLKRNSEQNLGSLEMIKREIDGDEWVTTWKKYYHPIHLGKVVICPEWIDYKAEDGEIIVKMDPGMAFGTGEHETTSMCVELLQKYLTEESVVIDVGCGSGILGITACKLGAKKAYLTDIDPLAVKASKSNATLNHVEEKVVPALSNLLDDTPIKAEILVANITADILIILSETISKNIKDDGTIILSGILTTKLQDVLNQFRKKGFEMIEHINKGEWDAVALKKVEDK